MPITVSVDNPFQPHARRVCEYNHPLTPREWMDDQGIDEFTYPILCLINDTPIMRADWASAQASGDDIMSFTALPAAPVAALGFAAIMNAFGSSIATAVGGVFGITGTVGLGLVQAGIGMVGLGLIGALFAPPRPRSPELNSTNAASPTYSLNARGNQARLGAPIPVIYGRHKIYPDFAAAPWTHYNNNEQYVHQLHCIGQGHYDIEGIFIDDTPISSFSEITTQTINPGGSITLFNPLQVTAPEVAGQEIDNTGYVGPFVVNPPDTQATQIHIDVVLPRGLYAQDNSGNLQSITQGFTVYARPIDNNGVATGGWSTLGTQSITAATATPQRRSYTYNVTAARYQVRIMGAYATATDNRTANTLTWQGARATINGNTRTNGITLLAIKMQATDNLSNRSRGLVNCIVKRKLPTWTSGGGWTAPTYTRSPAWAIADIARASYGGGLADTRIDLTALAALNTAATSRGDNFDAVFDSNTTVWDALTNAARAMRATPFLQGGTLRIVRDQAQSLPVALFGPRNIVKDSLAIEGRLSDDDTATAIEATFHNGITWRSDQFTVSLDNDTSNTSKITLFGFTNEAHARREALYLARANRYRRKQITFATELEGLIPTLGDLITITHPMPRWGAGGEITDWDSSTRTLTLSEPMAWGDGNHYIALRNRTGGLAGTYSVTRGSDDNTAIVGGSDALTIDTDGERESTYFAFGTTTTDWSVLARVLSVRPRRNQVHITAIIEDNRVHIDS